MTTKYSSSLFLFFSLFFVQGCSFNNSSLNDSSAIESNDNPIEANPQITQLSSNAQMADNPGKTSIIESKPEFNDVWLRLPELYQLSDIDNERIQHQKTFYIKHKKHIEDISKRASPFLYFITEEVSKRNMPGEIALLPIIESSFKTNARSRMKASGLWQFMPATGRYFGLKQNWWYDGRRDVYRSTLAALTYLERLNKYYKGDWLLALAAYNAGAGNIDKAIKKNRKQGKPVDYWSLSLPKETYKYIPKLLAVSKIIQNHQSYGVSLSPIENSPRLQLVNTQSQIALSVVAEMADISLDEMRSYNPAFKQWATDPDGPHILLIPIDKVDYFEEQLTLLDDKDRVQWSRHKIRSGESLSVIARQYKISVSVLKTANHLKNNRIRAGKYLMVPSGGKDPVAYHPVASPAQQISSNTKTYKVRKGDSFWTIARRFNMSHQKLASINGLSSGDTLSIGQTLRISKKTAKKDSLKLENQTVDTQTIETQAINYKVKSGDSLYTISRQFKVTVNDLKRWNRLNLKKYLKPGQKLKVFTITSSQPI